MGRVGERRRGSGEAEAERLLAGLWAAPGSGLAPEAPLAAMLSPRAAAEAAFLLAALDHVLVGSAVPPSEFLGAAEARGKAEPGRTARPAPTRH